MWLRVIGSPAGSASDAAGVSAAETAASHGGVGTLDLVLVAVEQPEHLDAHWQRESGWPGWRKKSSESHELLVVDSGMSRENLIKVHSIFYILEALRTGYGCQHESASLFILHHMMYKNIYCTYSMLREARKSYGSRTGVLRKSYGNATGVA